MNKTIATLFFLLPLSVSGECLNEINNESDLLLSNICNYESTAVVEIESISLNGKCNPLTYFKSHRTYTINASVKKSIKGNSEGKICFFQWREEPFDNVRSMKSNIFITSFNKSNNCAVLEVGSILKANETLLKLIENEDFK